MKTRTSHQNGLSLLEVLMVVASVALFILFVLPMLPSSHGGARTRAKRISCISNLKQVGLATRLYANDHGERFPWMVSTNFNPTNTSGSLEITNSPLVFVHFQALSNELVTPKVLHCASDDARSKGQEFTGLSNKNVSYFVGFDAVETNPQSILSGDRNVTGGLSNRFLRLLSANEQLGWSKEMHRNAGNIGLGDGSVQQVNSQSLTRQRASITNEMIRLAIP